MIQSEVIEKDGHLLENKFINFSLACDHRVIDGATMVKFNNVWKSYLENPITMLAMTR